MAEIKGVAHFSIPVSDVDKSTRFYTEIVGCKFLSALPDKSITFLDAGGVCVLLIKRPAPINKEPLEMSNGVHHAFMIDATEYPLSHARAARRLPSHPLLWPARQRQTRRQHRARSRAAHAVNILLIFFSIQSSADLPIAGADTLAHFLACRCDGRHETSAFGRPA
jgi:catechol 2,3-dioxygenase-like lactoylglutathione lyase family enzyme